MKTGIYEYMQLRVVEHKIENSKNIEENYDFVKISLETRKKWIEKEISETLKGKMASKKWKKKKNSDVKAADEFWFMKAYNGEKTGLVDERGSKEIVLSKFVKAMGWKFRGYDQVDILSLFSVMGEHGYRLVNIQVLIDELKTYDGNISTTRIVLYLFELEK